MAKSKAQSDAEKVLENPEALREKLFQSEEFFVKHREIVLGLLGAIVLGIAAFLFYNYRQDQQNVEAQKEMYSAVFYFEADSLNKALEGDLKNPGLLSISEEYSGTKAGNLANFYIGSIYLKQGKFEDAIKFLNDFSSDDLLVQARAYSLIGDAYMEQNNFDKAAEFYTKAAEYKPNEQFTPSYLMKAALAYELKEDYSSAKAKYAVVIDEYPKSQQFNDAKKYQARAEAIINRK